jgi:pilus assembly protein CpaF
MSLLKRLEQGQGANADSQPQQPALPDKTEKKPGQSGSSTTLSSRSSLGNTPEPRNPTADIKTRVQNKLINDLNPSMDLTKTDELKKNILQSFEQILNEESIILSRPERQKMFEQIIAEILGFGPMQSVLDDDSVTEVMVNGPKNVYVERKGRLIKVPISFENNDHVKRVIDRIVSPLGRRIDESSPYVDARLPDGSRVNAVIPPISLIGPTITIRKFSKSPITIQQMVNFGSISAEAVEFLKASVYARCNIVISGGTGSGKTTLLNVLSGFIPPDERILTIENAAELQLRQEHVVTLESRPPNIEGKGEITIRQLVVNALRMRPDRIVVGEIRDEAALDMLQAMNTGHDGSMTTLHSNSPRDTLSRLETMTMMAGMDLPVRAIREQISSAVNLICHQERMRDGTRKVTHITEVLGMEGDVITTTDIFIFEQTGLENGKIIGQLRPTGLRPRFMERIEAAGIQLPNSVFGINATRRH